ncbi:CopD family protein [Acidithiobacillus montserratensis]|uniref:CopD family protein n=1 Tax=Acidithiobacillus montserratensis TaxID=2729135 RepID=A0ACD5HIT9_9PROT|nr:CopD family protein [Acidithiobacillus montserratensis]MBN2680459.1 DUF4149 domain-containing protein [Acidithiobacillaceae bacterium]MBU2748743.1 DUF4149 domain-containing protein [Acidithiobacillus montserratensis]
MNNLWIEQFVHILAVIVWIGGLFFVTMVLAPTLKKEIGQNSTRIALMHVLLRRFFFWVLIASLLLLLTGYSMVFVFYGGFAALSVPVWLMVVLGTIMVLIVLHTFFAPLKRLRRAVRDQDWQAGAKALGQVRMLANINLGLSFVVILVGIWGVFGTPW